MWKPSSFPVCRAAQLLLVAVVFAAWVEELAKQQLSRCLSACNIVYIAYSPGCCPLYQQNCMLSPISVC